MPGYLHLNAAGTIEHGHTMRVLICDTYAPRMKPIYVLVALYHVSTLVWCLIYVSCVAFLLNVFALRIFRCEVWCATSEDLSRSHVRGICCRIGAHLRSGLWILVLFAHMENDSFLGVNLSLASARLRLIVLEGMEPSMLSSEWSVITSLDTGWERFVGLSGNETQMGTFISPSPFWIEEWSSDAFWSSACTFRLISLINISYFAVEALLKLTIMQDVMNDIA